MATLVNVLRALATGELSSREYTERIVQRIHQREKSVGAFAHIDFDRARALAEACDRHRQRGGSIGPLHGLPVAVKDIFDTSELRTEMGLPFYANRAPEHDAEIVIRMRAAGGFVLGKTVTAEAGFTQLTETRNPWNLQHTTGGSSSGSAAAVAAGFTHAAIGTQTNDSVIRPAAYCGVVGYKPSHGLLPLAGAFCFSPTLDHVGVFTRSVLDAAALCAPLSDNDALAAEVKACATAPRLGVIAEFPWTRLEPETRQQLGQVVRVLDGRGARTTTVDLPPLFAGANVVHRLIMLHEGARQHSAMQGEYRAHLSSALNDALDEGRRISPASYGEAMVRRARLREAATLLFADFDAIIAPPASGAAPLRFADAGDPGFCTLWSLLGFPVVVVPCGYASNGLPLGVQIAGPAGSDQQLLAVAHWIQVALGRLPRPTVAQ